MLYDGLGDYNKMKAVADSLSPMERHNLVQVLREIATMPDSGHDPLASRAVLVELGDDQAIAEEVRTFPRAPNGGMSNFLSSIQPKVIPALAPYLLVTEPSSFGGVGGFARSFFTAEVIRELLERSPYFSTAVNRWAASWKGKGGKGANPPYEFREEMRKWWAANDADLVSGNYALVQPGDSPSTESVSAMTAVSGPTPFPESISAGAHSSPSASPMPVPSQESSLPLILVLSIIALVVAGLVLLLRIKR